MHIIFFLYRHIYLHFPFCCFCASEGLQHSQMWHLLTFFFFFSFYRCIFLHLLLLSIRNLFWCVADAAYENDLVFLIGALKCMLSEQERTGWGGAAGRSLLRTLAWFLFWRPLAFIGWHYTCSFWCFLRRQDRPILASPEATHLDLMWEAYNIYMALILNHVFD